MSRLIPNFFTVVQRLLDITVMVSLRDFWHFPKEVDYSLICVLTMHHLEHCPFCIIIHFRFGTELHCLCICILNDPVIQGWSYKFYRYNFPRVIVMSGFVVIVNMNCLRQDELLYLSIHNLTWQKYWSYYEPQYFYSK